MIDEINLNSLCSSVEHCNAVILESIDGKKKLLLRTKVTLKKKHGNSGASFCGLCDQGTDP